MRTTMDMASPQLARELLQVCLVGPADRDECRHSLGLIEDAIEQLPAVALRGM